MSAPNSAQNVTGLIVAGFHRSGTSMVGQMLESHGISLGRDLIGGNEFNRFGYFEDWPVVRFHNAVLQRVGADWARPLGKPTRFTDEEQRWVQDYIRTREQSGKTWALKDPRISSFAQQWKELGKGLRFLIVYRSPAECGNSLNRRSCLEIARSTDTDPTARQFYSDPDLALRLWVEHNRELIELRKAYPHDCVVLGHHHVLDGYDLMAALRDQFGMTFKAEPVASIIDPTALSKQMTPLYCVDPELVEAALKLWQELQQHDIAVGQGWPTRSVGETLVLDTEGHLARASMLAVQISDLYGKSAEQQSKIEELTLKLAKLRPLARKASKAPLSFYFMKRTKYRLPIEDLLSN